MFHEMSISRKRNNATEQVMFFVKSTCKSYETNESFFENDTIIITWGQFNPVHFSVLTSSYWYGRDFNIDEFIRFLMQKRTVHTKVHFPKLIVVKDCFKRNEISISWKIAHC